MEGFDMKILEMVIASMLLCFLLISSVTGYDQGSDVDVMTSAFYGTVFDNETGEPIIDAFVYAFDSDYQNYYKTITDENGHYFMEVDFGGVYYLYANKEDYDDQECIAWIEPGKQNEVNFTLDPKHFDHVIEGEVEDQNTMERLSDVHIILYGYIGDVPRPLKEHDTNSSGEFLFNLNDGRYTLTFEKKDYYSEYFNFQIDGNGLHLTKVLKKYYQGVFGIVTDPSGSPMEGVTLCLENDESVYYNVSDSDGNYEILIPYGGDFTITAYKDGYRPDSEFVRIDGNLEEVNLEMRKAEYPVLLQLLYSILSLLGIL